MTDLRKAVEMALEALESVYGKGKRCEVAIKALRQALAQPEQEPVQNMKTYEIICPHCNKPHDWTYLKAEWVGLTGLEQKELMAMNSRYAVFETEAKLKEKNGG